MKKGLGGRVRIILSGGAPLASHIETFFRVVSCAHVLQGYGMSSLHLHFHKTKLVDPNYHTFSICRFDRDLWWNICLAAE